MTTNLYHRGKPEIKSRWVTFENPLALAGGAATENKGGKGHPSDLIAKGEVKTLLDLQGSGLISRIWLTIDNRSPQTLRSLRIDMYWDDAETPAVSAPLGDFFGVGLGRRTPFQSELFSDPEGRSFNCFIPMPFRTAARITLTNESEADPINLFYEINLQLDVDHNDDTLYFHTHWRREQPNVLGQPFDLLPTVQGAGRYLGCNVGIICNPVYQLWWGEGEVKVWLDDDREHPTLCGTGTEDLVGSAWGLGAYSHRTQGCTIADSKNDQWAFYRYHTIDPIYFHTHCRVAMDIIGGGGTSKVGEHLRNGVPLIPVTRYRRDGTIVKLLERDTPRDLLDPANEGWCNFYRQDDCSATAYFYLDRPENGLPLLPPAADRATGLLENIGAGVRADA